MYWLDLLMGDVLLNETINNPSVKIRQAIPQKKLKIFVAAQCDRKPCYNAGSGAMTFFGLPPFLPFSAAARAFASLVDDPPFLPISTRCF
jgi:hypothetical protein